MAQSFPSLSQIAAFLDHLLQADLFLDDPHGIYQPFSLPIKRLGLALEPFEGLDQWIKSQSLDALFLHRPWQLQPSEINAPIGIVAYHLAFDERLTIGFNPFLSQALALMHVEPFGEKEGRPLGMMGQVVPQAFGTFREKISDLFEGEEAYLEGRNSIVSSVAVVGAMTAKLVQQAMERHVDVYITGQIRKHALDASYQESIHIIAVGHHRSEVWGLRKLAALLHIQWPTLEVVIVPFTPLKAR